MTQRPDVQETIERGRKAGRRFGLGCLILGVPTLFVVSCLGGVAFYAYLGLVADATLHVQHASGSAALTIDGETQPGFSAPEIRTIELPRGRRVVGITHDEPRTYTLDVTGFDELLVSTDPNVCFAQLNVGAASVEPAP